MKKDNLPVPQKNNFRTKLKRSILILLSSVGLINGAANAVSAQEQISKLEQVCDEKKNLFEKGLKVKSENERLVQDLLEQREEKGFGEYSQETGQGDKVKEILERTFNQIDKNFSMNAAKRGKKAWDKQAYKNYIVSLVCNLDDIVFVDEEQAEKYFSGSKAGAAGYCDAKENKVFLRDEVYESLDFSTGKTEKRKEEIKIHTVVHELEHTDQAEKMN